MQSVNTNFKKLQFRLICEKTQKPKPDPTLALTQEIQISFQSTRLLQILPPLHFDPVFSSLCSLQVYHRPAGAPRGDPPPNPGPHSWSNNHHHAHHLPLPPQADSESATASKRSFYVQEHVVT